MFLGILDPAVVAPLTPPPFFFEHRQSFSCPQFLVTIAQFDIHYWVAVALSWSQTVLKDFWNLVILMFGTWCRLN